MSLGNDLTTIREEKGLSLEDIFEATKISVHTLKSIENDTLLDSGRENKTYLRSFIRSYAKALKIPDEYILKCLSATENGTYNHDLLKLLNHESVSGEFSIQKDKVEIHPTSPDDSNTSEAESYSDEIKNNPTVKVSPITSNPLPTADSINWADMNSRINAVSNRPNLGKMAIVLFFVVIFGAIGYYFSGNLVDMFSSDGEEQSTEMATSNDENPVDSNNENTIVAVGDSIATDNSNVEPITTPTSGVSNLPDTLTIALYAAYDKLEPVRVTSDFNNRTNPFWMDQGEAYFFDFRDTLKVRGQYSRMLLMYNGNVINNPRQNYFSPTDDAILITRSILESSEFRNSKTSGFPEDLDISAPDSIIYKIRF